MKVGKEKIILKRGKKDRKGKKEEKNRKEIERIRREKLRIKK